MKKILCVVIALLVLASASVSQAEDQESTFSEAQKFAEDNKERICKSASQLKDSEIGVEEIGEFQLKYLFTTYVEKSINEISDSDSFESALTETVYAYIALYQSPQGHAVVAMISPTDEGLQITTITNGQAREIVYIIEYLKNEESIDVNNIYVNVIGAAQYVVIAPEFGKVYFPTDTNLSEKTISSCNLAEFLPAYRQYYREQQKKYEEYLESGIVQYGGAFEPEEYGISIVTLQTQENIVSSWIIPVGCAVLGSLGLMIILLLVTRKRKLVK